jgi:cytochrome c-type biogenesis protein CcmH
MVGTLLLAAVLLVIVTAAMVAPLLLGARAVSDRRDYDRAVYRDQLQEMQRDLARGALSESDTATTRLEIQRRLLAVDALPQGALAGAARSWRVAIPASLFVVIGASGFYWWLGAPSLPDLPYGGRTDVQAGGGTSHEGTTPPPGGDLADAAKTLEQKLKSDPKNVSNWVLFARTQAELGDYQQAAGAYRKAIELGQKDADTDAAYGEMLVLAADGIVSPAAKEVLERAKATEADNQVARYYLALADAQAGDNRKAVDAWVALMAETPEDSPLREELAHKIANAAKSGGFDMPSLPKGRPPTGQAEAEAEASPPPSAEAPSVQAPSAEAPTGPTPDQVAAAGKMSEAERQQMVHNMIDGLAAKLQEQPNDLNGWMRLGRAYAVEGEIDKAADAYDHAATLQPSDPGLKLQVAATLIDQLAPSIPIPQRARDRLSEAAAIVPEDPDVLWYQGLVAAHDGHPDEAREHWTKLLSKLPKDNDDYKSVEAALAELDPAKPH